MSTEFAGQTVQFLDSGTSEVAPTNLTDQPEYTRVRTSWGRDFVPKTKDRDGRREYRRICDAINREVMELANVMPDGTVTEDGAGVAAEISNWLETLYDCDFGEGESLKGVVVAIQSQLNNAKWTATHLEFLRQAISFLRARYIVNESTVEEINDMIESLGLDMFRGTVSEPSVTRKYRIVTEP